MTAPVAAGGLEPFYRYDVRRAITHTLLIKRAGADICRVIFQRRELRSLAASPVFSRLKQPFPNSLTLVPAADRNLRDVAVEYFPVRWIRRLFEPDIDESNDLTAELRDKSDAA